MPRYLVPNSTQIPDVILDDWMAVLSGAELKVLLYVARRTYGFGKDADNISLNQIAAGMFRRDGTPLNRGTGLSRSGVKVACNSLIEKGLLIRTARTAEGGREPEESTYRLNLYAPLPGDEPPQSPPEGVEEVGQKLAYLGQIMAYPGRPKTGRGVGQKLALQETHIQETQASSSEPDPEPAWDADAALVQRLVGEGVGLSVAVRLAREKPEVCRRCLEYLPFAQPKTTKGAWLANAIRDEYGPPKKYLDAQAEAERTLRGRGSAQGQGLGRQIARSCDRLDPRVRETYAHLEREQGGPFLAFTTYLAGERAKAERFASSLTEQGRQKYLASFEDPERRLELFGQWLKMNPVPVVSAGDASRRPRETGLPAG